MSAVTRTAGVAGTFPVTFSQPPVQPPTLTIYTDPARSVVAVPAAALVATANPQVWTASYPASLVAGTYYLTFSAVYTVGQPAVLDADDTLTLTAAGVTVGGSVPTIAELREHLNIRAEATDVELSDKLAAAVRLLRTHPDYPGVAAALDGPDVDPLLRLAIMEQVRDIWSGTQRGAGGASMVRRFEGEYAYQGSSTESVAGLGRPALPPYVARLLVSYSRLGGSAVYEPRGEFPPALVWPLS